MARISGQEKQRFIDKGFISAADAWTDETSFGKSNTQNSQIWDWNDKGLNCTVNELLSFAMLSYCSSVNHREPTQLTRSRQQHFPKYFELVELAGADVAPTQYGGLVPLVAIYKIDWASYNAAHP